MKGEVMMITVFSVVCAVAVITMPSTFKERRRERREIREGKKE